MECFTVDQAGKVEKTSDDTILSLYSESIQYSIKIPKELKQELFNNCLARKKNNLTFRIFAFGLHLLLKNRIKNGSKIIIDDEYPKHGKDIKNLLLRYADTRSFSNCEILFDVLGKKDCSHRIANQTFSGKLKPNEIISPEQMDLAKILPRRKLKEFMK